MIDEAALQLEARLVAIEHMLAHALKITYGLAGATPDAIAGAHNRFRENLKTETFGGDPATSDLMAAEVEAAMLKLLASIETVLGLVKSQ